MRRVIIIIIIIFIFSVTDLINFYAFYLDNVHTYISNVIMDHTSLEKTNEPSPININLVNFVQNYYLFPIMIIS